MTGKKRIGFEQNEEQVRLGDLLWDVHAAGARLLEYTEGRDWQEFEQSELLQAFARKMLELMAEPLRELGRRFPEEFARVPGAEALASADAPLPSREVWRLVAEIVPNAVGQVRAMLEDWHGGAAFGTDAAQGSEPRVIYDERPPDYEE